MSKRGPGDFGRGEAAPWTEAHRREALRGALRIVDEIAAAGPVHPKGRIEIEACDIASERAFRAYFARNTHGGVAATIAVRIDREMARVRALVEGRLVRESSERWHVRLRDKRGIHTSEPMDEARARREAGSVTNPAVTARVFRVRVARLRRAS